MKRSRFTEEQIISILKEYRAGFGVKVLGPAPALFRSFESYTHHQGGQTWQ